MKREEEYHDEFLTHNWNLIHYGQKSDVDEQEKLEGLAFSILFAIDGTALALSGYVLVSLDEEGGER